LELFTCHGGLSSVTGMIKQLIHPRFFFTPPLVFFTNGLEQPSAT
jgi:hypothetical protein